MSIATELKSNLRDDGISFVAGLALTGWAHGIPVPFFYSTFKTISKAIKKSQSTDYVDWELANWPTLYRSDLPNVLEIVRKAHRYLLPQVLVHQNPTDLPLANYGLRFSFDPIEFELSSETRARTEKAYSKILYQLQSRSTFYDEEAIRLIDISGDQKGILLRVQPVSYTNYIRTNLLLDYKSKKDTASLRETVNRNEALEPLAKSELANPLGINVLIFTADGRLVVVRRSKKVAIRPGELAPCGSGSMTRTDAEASGRALVKPAIILREVREETGIPLDQSIEDTLTYLGVTRELIRGGVPEIFFSARTSLSESEILTCARKAHDRHEISKVQTIDVGSMAFQPVVSKLQFQQMSVAADTLLDSVWDKASLPLKTGLALWLNSKFRAFDSTS